MTGVRIIGIKGGFDFEQVSDHFSKMGVEVAILNPQGVCGADHIRSAVMHADLAFDEGRNRSNKLVNEVILYAACERNIRDALKKMKPVDGDQGFVLVVLGYDGDLRLDEIGAVEDAALTEPSQEKAGFLGAPAYEGVSPADSVLELVASVDLMKQ